MKGIVKSALLVGAMAATSFATIDQTAYQTLENSLLTPGTRFVPDSTRPWYLKGSVVVPATCTLDVRPGTWFFGSVNPGDNQTSLLIVAPGGVILAQGTADKPIVFTAFGDDPKDPYDLGPGAKGMWGGVLICGKAPTSDEVLHTPNYPEGIPAGLPGVYYRGTNPNDNSGILRYVSVRHGGTAVTSNSETNGLSLYGVGAGTVIENVEIFANSDDGVEFFGGNVNTKYISVAYCSDDAFDFDEGYIGKNQFWFAVEQNYEGDRSGEWDGGWPKNATRFSSPTVFNFTFIGSPRAQPGITMRDSVGGFYANGIVTNDSILCLQRTRHTEAGNPQAIGSWAQTLGAGLDLRGLILWPRNPATWATAVTPAADSVYYKANLNRIVDPMIRSINLGFMNGWPKLDPRPDVRSPALNAAFIVPKPADPFFVTANYQGAFSANAANLWIRKWTALDQYGILTPIVEVAPGNGSMIHPQQPVKLSFFLKNAGWSINAASPDLKLFMDGVDVKATFVSKVKNIPLVSGGIMYYVDFTAAQGMIPVGKPVEGKHLLTYEFPISGTSEVLKGSWEYSIVR